jgi:FlaA1/EpsC-like NDP-sugar epimerase
MDFLDTYYGGKDILVTGACGSIGSEVVRHLLKHKVKRIRMFDNNETGLFDLGSDLNDDRVRELYGDIRDIDRLRVAMKGADAVIHCAALKHVSICEYNPTEAYKTNVIGTSNVIEVAREIGVERVLFISTDKSVNPVSMMGATKLLGEKLIMSSTYGDCKTKLSCVRFGNVANSRGSVIPVFIKQIRSGGPVALTSPEMTRFFMSISDAVSLILRCLANMQGHEIFILRMKSLRIVDLAEVLIEELSKKPTAIKTMGIRPGEKLHESLMTAAEASGVEMKEDIFILHPLISVPHYVEKMKGKLLMLQKKDYDSSEADKMTKEEIRSMLAREKII